MVQNGPDRIRVRSMILTPESGSGVLVAERVADWGVEVVRDVVVMGSRPQPAAVWTASASCSVNRGPARITWPDNCRPSVRSIFFATSIAL
jgi:hypothetical protein